MSKGSLFSEILRGSDTGTKPGFESDGYVKDAQPPSL